MKWLKQLFCYHDWVRGSTMDYCRFSSIFYDDGSRERRTVWRCYKCDAWKETRHKIMVEHKI